MQLVTTTPQATVFPPPDRFLFEREVKSLLPPKAINRMKELTGKDQAIVSAMFNPSREDRHNPVYMFLIFLWAFDQICDGLADKQLNLVIRERRKWLAATCEGSVNHPSLTKCIGDEFFEAIEQEMSGATLDVKIKEYTDLRNAVDKKLDLLNAERQRAFGGEIASETREKVRGLLKNRQGRTD